jgi:hypothetical protein
VELFKRNEKMRKMLETLEFFEYSYSGGEEYTKQGYLKKHERETPDAFKRRCEESVYVNFCAPIIDLYNAHLFRAPISREFGTLAGNPLFERFKTDADFEGNDYETCIKGVVERGSVYGIFGVIVDKPSIKVTTLAEELAQDVRPYLALYEPEDIWDFKFQRVAGGRPVLTELVLAEESHHLKVWKRDVVELYEQCPEYREPKFLLSTPNPLGEIPFVLHKNRASFDRFEATSDVADIAYINRRIYQLDTAAFEVVDSAAFPLIEIPADSLPTTGATETDDIEIGTGNGVIRASGDTVGHRYVEPTHTSLALMLQWRDALISDLHQVARAAHTTARVAKSAQSGVALEIEFQQLNALLADKGKSAGMTEARILRLVAKWLRVEFDGNVEYSDSYGVRDLAHDIDTLIKAKTVVTSPTFAAEMGKDIARRMMGDDKPTEVAAVEAELSRPPASELGGASFGV